MDLLELVGGLKDASPFVVATVALVWMTNRVLGFFEKRGESESSHATASGLETVNSNIRVLAQEFSHHVLDEEHRGQSMVGVLERIEAHLITANAKTSGNDPEHGGMSASNQRHMIEYQWAWCRDETIKIVTNSILKNGIKGREEVIARRVAHSWRLAAEDAHNSLKKLDGLSYPYEDLFTTRTTQVWSRVWELATPLYYRKQELGMDQALEDFAYRVESLFVDSLREHFNKYDDPESGFHHRHQQDHPTGEFSMVGFMAEQLRGFDKPRTDLDGDDPQPHDLANP